MKAVKATKAMNVTFAILLSVVTLTSGCVFSRTRHLSKTEVLLDAHVLTKAELLDKLKIRSASVKTLKILNAAIAAEKVVSKEVVTDYGKGTAVGYTATIVVDRPSRLRMQIDAAGFPGTDVVSDEKQYKVSIPWFQAFGVAATASPIVSDDFKCNLRPVHILDALFVDGEKFIDDKEISVVVTEDTVSLSDGKHSYYRVDFNKGDVPLQELWFDRYLNEVTRKIQFTKDGAKESDVQYSSYEVVDSIPFPKKIEIDRPLDKYKLEMNIVKMSLNEPIEPEKFVLDRPSGADELDFKTCKAVKQP